MSSFLEPFQSYFARPIAEKAASSLKESAQIEIQIHDERLLFSRVSGKNFITSEPATSPDVTFTLTPAAAQAILDEPSEEIGKIGVAIARLIVSQDPSKKVSLKLHSGFLTLWNRGYFGILTAGGAEFASFLASRGLSGIDSIRSALKNLKK